MNIILIGYMGAGKSTVAKHLGLPVLEMDELVLQKTGCRTMKELIARGGEILLRETELAIAKEHAAGQNRVVSTGGGVVLNKLILDLFRQNGGRVVFLDVPFEQIVERLKNDASRPLFARCHYDFRLPLYRAYADLIVDATGSPEQVATSILHGL